MFLKIIANNIYANSISCMRTPCSHISHLLVLKYFAYPPYLPICAVLFFSLRKYKHYFQGFKENEWIFRGLVWLFSVLRRRSFFLVLRLDILNPIPLLCLRGGMGLGLYAFGSGLLRPLRCAIELLYWSMRLLRLVTKAAYLASPSMVMRALMRSTMAL